MPRWPERITAKYLAEMTTCLRIGDVVILPRKKPSEKDLSALKILVMKKPGLMQLLPAYQRERIGKEPPIHIFWAFEHLYRDHCDDLEYVPKEKWKDPYWLSHLPPSVQASLHYEAAFMKFEYKSFAYNAEFTFNNFIGFRYILLRGGMLSDLYQAAELWRQGDNPQLSNKIDPACGELGIGLSTRHSVQTREMHSLGMYPLATLVTYNNRGSLTKNQRRHTRADGLVHDCFTPAMGDEVMEIDPSIFCEIINSSRLPELPNWEKKRKKLRLSNRRIIAAIHGNLLEGDLTDKIDKIEYMSLDLTHLLGLCWSDDVPKPVWLKRMSDIVRACPELCTIWDSIFIDNGKVYFQDPIRLEAFLLVRAMNFRWNYYGEFSRSTETILSKSVLNFLYRSGKILASDFRDFTREHFAKIINDFVGHWQIMDHAGFAIGDPRVETFATPEEAYRREKYLFDRGIVLSAIEDCRGKINPATHFLVQMSNGDILPFVEAHPEKAEIIHKICQISRPIYLMYLQNLHIPLDSYLQMREYKRMQFAQRGQLI